ncbi:aminoacyl-tRNA hydrolase [Helicobacter cetorum]|uniref:Peptidyl-tRNA hydrolase n=1 Tax=Helicobacter cetorum (strain ATCC BAA-429 / MIT 00-7128) TaxID=182217 RepID=I0EKW0_HELC0|nr:aminoacyl-tRNA hydrolase [Helicobacter cetorum]AFI03579.1 peptidyl-tRNA hydrolase [Helicobacter cetorum MIT 00-7128]
MTLLVGLGNPTERYAYTRHNVGFDILDLLVKDFNISFTFYSKHNACVCIYNDFILLKPQTYMNLSGESVLSVKNFYKPQEILVIHDELDLALGVMKFKNGGGNGGHNGLKSIDLLCSNNYYRLRVGISKGANIIEHVLSRFNENEEPLKNAVFEHAKNALKFFIKTHDFNATQNRFTLKNPLILES